MASEVKAQEFVHQLEHGKGRWWILFGLILGLAGILVTSFLFIHVVRTAVRGDRTPIFRGLSHAKGMEQACIARELARGNGFSTKVIKPAAIELINSRKGEGYFNDLVNGNVAFMDKIKRLGSEIPPGKALTLDETKALLKQSPEERAAKYSPKAAALLTEIDQLLHLTSEQRGEGYGRIPDIYHSPLNPWINSLALRAVIAMNDSFKWRTDENGKVDFWYFQPNEMVHLADLTIAAVSLLFFLGAILLNYFTISWIFDQRLSVIMVVVQLLCQQFWDFAETGLPQLLVLFLFSGAMMCLTAGMMAQTAGRRSWPWLAGAGLFFGLMALAHPLTLFIAVGAFAFVAMSYRPYGLKGLLVLGLTVLLLTPWFLQNSRVCGDFRGLSWQTKSFGLRGSESQIMRTLKEPDETIEPTNFVNKVLSQTLLQFDNLYYHLGKVPVALVFFLALLHNFKRTETRSLRWGIFLMWLMAVFGMSFFGYADTDMATRLQSNDLHLLFIPFFGAYGLALVLNLWSRVELEGHLVSNLKYATGAFTAVLLSLSSFPLWTRYLTQPTLPVNFPPYFPSIIARVGDWYTDRDVICSDMPWGVAWYTDRRSLWLPLAKRDFTTLNTFTFDGRINGLMLTPVSGHTGLQTDIDAGEYRDWSLFIRRDKRVMDPGARAYDHLPFNVINDEMSFLGASHYLIYSDRNRWSDRQ